MIRVHDAVSLKTDLPQHDLKRGELGTVVMDLGGAYEVEFLDDNGSIKAIVMLAADLIEETT
jgi:hypothetical protein